MGNMLRSGSGDQDPGGRARRSGRKRRRSWTDQQQPAIRPRPTLPYEHPPPTTAPSSEDQRRTEPVRRPPAPQRNWRDVPPVRRQVPPPETYGPDGYAPDHTPDVREAHQRAAQQERAALELAQQRQAQQRQAHQHQHQAPPAEQPGPAGPPHFPKKLTVTRVAALRGRQLTGNAVRAFRRAANADGADKSGLTALTYATMLNYASDAAMAVALANTLFFSAASADSSKGKVALYLLITVAPFALLAPVIGPMLDRIQRGRRLAMCAASIGQGLMCVVMAANFDTWLLYPAALGKMVLSKSFTVLKAAVTPRVVPPEITLAKTNARLTVFGLVAGAAFGGVAALILQMFDSPGALWFTALICGVGAVQAMRIPAWVEVTEGEVPASLSANPRTRRQPMGKQVVVALSGNATVRLLTGFLMMFAAFAVRAQTEGEPVKQLLLLGVVAGAAGAGSFIGNGIGARTHLGHPEQVVIGCIVGSLVSTVLATFAPGIGTAAIVGLVGATASAIAKNSLDAVIQDDLPEESRASAFGRSETVLQLAWVFGGAIGVLLPPTFWVGFLVVSVLLVVGLVQTIMTRRGNSLLPWFGGDRPIRPWRPGAPRKFTPSPAVREAPDQRT
jgi:MFS family permease